MSHFLFANNAGSTLAGGISNVATTCAVQSGAGALFPNPSTGQSFMMSFKDQATGLVREIVEVTARSGDTLTIVRAQENTSAQAWLAGDFAQMLCTAGEMAQMAQKDDLLFGGGGYFIDAGTANAVSLTLSPVPASISALAGAPIRIRKTTANTGAMTFTVNTLGGSVTKNLVNAGGAAMINGQLPNPCIFIAVYDPTSDVFRFISAVFPINIDAHTTGSLPVSRVSGVWQPLTADAEFYINASSGDDDNAGTIGAPWQTLQKAINYIGANIDLAGHKITIDCTGAFTSGVISSSAWRGGGPDKVIFLFESGSQLYVEDESCFVADAQGAGFSITSIGTPPLFGAIGTGNNGYTLFASRTEIAVIGPVNFDDATNAQVFSANGGLVTFRTLSYLISGGGTNHINAQNTAQVVYSYAGGLTTVSLSGTPAFTEFVQATSASVLIVPTTYVEYSGSATGKRYDVSDVSYINTTGGGSTFFPGNASGTAQNTWNYD